jgi:hypothetical protein
LNQIRHRPYAVRLALRKLKTPACITSLKSTNSMREWLSASLINVYGITGNAMERIDTTTTLATKEISGLEINYEEIRTKWSQIGDTASVGDTVFIYDPGSGFEGDTAITFRGRYLQPVKHRIQEARWPIVDGMGVYYRPAPGGAVTTDLWVDLTATTDRTPPSRASTYLRAWELIEGEDS